MTALTRASALIRVALANARERPTRSLFVAFAVALGVGIFGGSLVYGDIARAAFFADLARAARGIDVIATPTGDDGEAADTAALSAIPDIAYVDQRVSAT